MRPAHKLLSLSPDQQFLALVLLIVLCLLAWRMEAGESRAGEAPAAEFQPSWPLIAAAQAAELDNPAPAGRGGLPPEQAKDAVLPRWRPESAEDYAVQLGVFGSWHNALRAARELRGRSLRPELVLDDGPRPVLRLVVGHFPTRGQALAAVRSYRSQRHADAWVYGRDPATVSARWGH